MDHRALSESAPSQKTTDVEADASKLAPIFIVGVPRSGTTLLQNVLSRHSQIYSMPETHFFEVVLPKIGRSAKDLLSEAEAGTALASLEELMALSFEEDERQRLIESAGQGELDGRSLFTVVLERYRPIEDRPQRMRPAEKTPGHVQHLDEILGAYPQAQFVCIIREPKNTISSGLAMPFVETQWLVWHCARWQMTAGYVDRFAQEHPKALLTVHYEELLAESEATLRKMCDFLHLAFEDGMLEAGESQKVMLEWESWKAGSQGALRADRVEAWRDRFSTEHGWFIDRLTHGVREKNGYTGDEHLPWQARAKSLARNWTFLRRESKDDEVSLWLLRLCLELGQSGPARQLAWGLLLGNGRMLRNRLVRAGLIGRR